MTDLNDWLAEQRLRRDMHPLDEATATDNWSNDD